MFLKQRLEGHLIEVADLQELINPLRKEVKGRLHFGEEMQDAESFQKADLVFPSGEALPRCWTAPSHHAG
jgi:hypothetical protein